MDISKPKARPFGQADYTSLVVAEQDPSFYRNGIVQQSSVLFTPSNKDAEGEISRIGMIIVRLRILG